MTKVYTNIFILKNSISYYTAPISLGYFFSRKGKAPRQKKLSYSSATCYKYENGKNILPWKIYREWIFTCNGKGKIKFGIVDRKLNIQLRAIILKKYYFFPSTIKFEICDLCWPRVENYVNKHYILLFFTQCEFDTQK